MFGGAAGNVRRGIVDVDGIDPDVELDEIIRFDWNSPAHLVAVAGRVAFRSAPADDG